jgi:hypothetical protein
MKRTDTLDPVIAVYMRDVDRTLVRENLKLTPAERLDKFARFAAFASKMRRAGERAQASHRQPKR